MDQSPAQETQAFLSSVADEMESQAAKLESSNGAALNGKSSGKSTRGLDTQFASKMVYTACYTLSYGVCYPVFLACRYIPKNNELVNGLVDGGVSANRAVDEMMVRAAEWRLARREAADQANQEAEVVDAGAEALASA